MIPIPSQTKRRGRRNGSTYVIVLGTALIVTVMALSTMTLRLLQLRQVVAMSDARQATENARVGLQASLYQTRTMSGWRTSMRDGNGPTDQTQTGGGFSVQAFDEEDGDLTDDELDPVTFVSTGVHGDARSVMRTRLAPEVEALDCLGVGMCAGFRIRLVSATLNYRGTIAANNRINGRRDGIVWAHAEAVQFIRGSGYQRSITTGVAARTLPDASNLIAEYTDMATPISIASLPTHTPNLVRDPGMEVGDGDWHHSSEAGHTCTVEQNKSEAHSGSYSLWATSRANASDGPCYDLTHAFRTGGTFAISCWIKPETAARFRITLNVRINGVNTLRAIPWQWASTSWLKLSGNIRAPYWYGAVEHALLKIETHQRDAITDFHFDDISVVETGTIPRITHTVLSERQNPFGDTNSQGVYSVDCGGSDLLVEHSRIQGTLVVLNPRRLLIGPGATNIRPGPTNLPALIVDGEIRISLTSRGLSEFRNVVNYNPPSLPFEGIGSDSDQNDCYPSEISGVLYSSSNIYFTGAGPTQLNESNVVAARNIDLYCDVIQTDRPSALIDPPPGFFKIEMNPIRRSYGKHTQ